jgi:hypothetical protein
MGTMTMAQLEMAMKEAPEKMPLLIKAAMEKAATAMKAEARYKHLRGPKMPRGTTGGFDNSTLLSITGMKTRLASAVEIKGTSVEGWVGMNLTSRSGYPYPRAHEYGEGKMPERPWLRPSVYAKQELLAEEILQGVLNAYGSHFT